MNLEKFEKATAHGCSYRCMGLLRRAGTPVRERMSRTNLQRFGVENISQLPSIKERKIQTMIRNHGAKNLWDSPVFNLKRKQTMLARYGVENAHNATGNVDWVAAWKKQHQTKKALGTYGLRRSKIERELESALREHGLEVESSVQLHVGEVDLFLPEKNLYIQVDGVYWHGLDKSFEDLQRETSPRGLGRIRTFLRDREMDKWCQEHDVNLLRITDIEIKCARKGKGLQHLLQEKGIVN